MQPFPVSPRFASVTYVGSLKLAGPTTGVLSFEAPRTTIHQFKIDGEDRPTFQPLMATTDMVQLSETVVPSVYSGDIRSGMDRVLEAAISMPPHTELPSKTMLVSSRDTELVESLLSKAQNPPKAQIGGNPDPFLGGANPNHKPFFHVDYPSLQLFNLDEVKSTLRRGLAMNLFKQVMSVSTNPKALVDVLAALLENRPRN